MSIEFHPITRLFPPMTAEEFAELTDDIRENGLLEAIWTLPDGQIIDGRHRYLACQEAEVSPRFRVWDGEAEGKSLTAFVIGLNLHRRHLSASQRALCAATALPYFEEEARKRQLMGKSMDGQAGGRGRKKEGENLPANWPEGFGEARDQAGKAFGVSGRTVQRAVTVLKDGAPELAAAVLGGKVSLGKAVQLASLPVEKQEEVLQLGRDQIRSWARQIKQDIQGASMKPKINRAGNIYAPNGYDACQTPPYALDPLLKHLDPQATVWEPAAGELNLVSGLYNAGYRQDQVVASDILTGQNFFEWEPERWDLLVTNPPYSIKYEWLERCYELGKPFALLVPLEMLGAQSAQVFLQKHGFEMILLNRRVNFCMPEKGWEGSAAQFPVIWLCWKILPESICYGEIVYGNGTVS